ncbi:hypothetical protein T492DRAFT_835817 [Pavlovales sp. CCMP2436]|nr:hypothetical protein T492DRAFT_835817 [Pavlovales sp. CCMP2436]
MEADTESEEGPRSRHQTDAGSACVQPLADQGAPLRPEAMLQLASVGKRPLGEQPFPEGDVAHKRPALGTVFAAPTEPAGDEGATGVGAAGGSMVPLLALTPRVALAPPASTPRALGGAIAPDKENATPAPASVRAISLEPGSTNGRLGGSEWAREAEALRARTDASEAVRARDEALASADWERRNSQLELARERERSETLSRQREFLEASETDLRTQLRALQKSSVLAEAATRDALEEAHAAALRDDLSRERAESRASRSEHARTLETALSEADAARNEADTARADAAAAQAAQVSARRSESGAFLKRQYATFQEYHIASARRSESDARARTLAAEGAQLELDAALRKLARLEAVEAREAGLRRFSRVELERTKLGDELAQFRQLFNDDSGGEGQAPASPSLTSSLSMAFATLRVSSRPIACPANPPLTSPLNPAHHSAAQFGERLKLLRIQVVHASEREGALSARLRQAELAGTAKDTQVALAKDAAEEWKRRMADAEEAAANERRRAASAGEGGSRARWRERGRGCPRSRGGPNSGFLPTKSRTVAAKAINNVPAGGCRRGR